MLVYCAQFICFLPWVIECQMPGFEFSLAMCVVDLQYSKHEDKYAKYDDKVSR